MSTPHDANPPPDKNELDSHLISFDLGHFSFEVTHTIRHSDISYDIMSTSLHLVATCR